MRLLLDSHVVVWWLDGGQRLRRQAAQAIADPSNDVWVPEASRWELSIQQSLGRLRVDGYLRGYIAVAPFVELPVLGQHAVAVADLPPHHRDPFDRMLVAQAGIEELTLLTADPALSAYDISVLAA